MLFHSPDDRTCSQEFSLTTASQTASAAAHTPKIMMGTTRGFRELPVQAGSISAASKMAAAAP